VQRGKIIIVEAQTVIQHVRITLSYIFHVFVSHLQCVSPLLGM